MAEGVRLVRHVAELEVAQPFRQIHCTSLAKGVNGCGLDLRHLGSIASCSSAFPRAPFARVDLGQPSGELPPNSPQPALPALHDQVPAELDLVLGMPSNSPAKPLSLVAPGSNEQQRTIYPMQHAGCHTTIEYPRQSGAPMTGHGDQVRALAFGS